MLSDEELDGYVPPKLFMWLRAYGEVVERAVIERCEEVCEKVSDDYQSNERFKYAECKTDAETGASDCAAAIRAMLEDKNG